MKTYSVLFAEDVPHYGTAEIKARNASAALKAAKAYDLSEVTLDPEWENSVCKRIVYIEDPHGNTVYCDVPLDDYDLRSGGERERRLCDAAADMLRVLELCEDVLSELSRLDDGTPSVSALNAAREVIAKARGGKQ
ncbi:MAG TPA: hypothetical protein VGG72_20205 [Bryobacteraceae bacterium]|jgi:hypothetical protein